MLLVGSKTEAGFIVFCDTLVTANLVVRLRHIFERLNAECRPPIVRLRLNAECCVLSARRSRICRQPLHKAPSQHRFGILDDLLKLAKRLNCAPRKQLLLDRLLHGAPHAHSGFERQPLECFERRFTDSPRGRVDHAQQSDRVVRVLQQLQIRDHVLDLGALVEREAAHNVVFQSIATQRFFEQSRL